jgi:hypothetical protein
MINGAAKTAIIADVSFVFCDVARMSTKNSSPKKKRFKALDWREKNGQEYVP